MTSHPGKLPRATEGTPGRAGTTSSLSQGITGSDSHLTTLVKGRSELLPISLIPYLLPLFFISSSFSSSSLSNLNPPNPLRPLTDLTISRIAITNILSRNLEGLVSLFWRRAHQPSSLSGLFR